MCTETPQAYRCNCESSRSSSDSALAIVPLVLWSRTTIIARRLSRYTSSTRQRSTTPVSPIGTSNWTSTAMTRSEEHTTELQSLMRISYAVFWLKKKNIHNKQQNITTTHKLKNKYQICKLIN